MEAAVEQLSLLKVDERRLCSCGCGLLCEVGKSYRHGHNRRGAKKPKRPDPARQVRPLTKSEKIRYATRLFFPPQEADENLGSYQVRKFVFFCLTYIVHIAGAQANQPFVLDDWELDLVKRLFGTLTAEGLRQYKKCLLSVARRNGKTTFCAALALYFLCEESFSDEGSEIYVLSVDEKQARILGRIARIMVLKNERLNSLLIIRLHPANITNPLTHSFLEVLSSKVETKAGRNSSVVLIDEAKGLPSREAFDIMETSMGSRRQPLMVTLSTSGENEGTFYFELYSYAKKILLDPSLDPTFLAIIYEVEKEADPFDESVWPDANPALKSGYRSLQEMRDYALKAKNDPSWEGTFRREYLNQWISYNSTSWLAPGEWDSCFEARDAENNIPNERERKVWLGLDTGGSQDLTVLCLFFEPLEAGGRWDIEVEIWVPGENLTKKARHDHLAYDAWLSRGLINFSGKPTLDVGDLTYVVGRIFNVYKVQGLGFDPYRLRKFITDLETLKIPDAKLIPVAQNAKTMGAAIDEVQAKIANKTLRHGGHPAMKAMSDNVRLTMDSNGNKMLDRGKSTSKIDGIAALCIAQAAILLKLQRGGV